MRRTTDPSVPRRPRRGPPSAAAVIAATAGDRAPIRTGRDCSRIRPREALRETRSPHDGVSRTASSLGHALVRAPSPPLLPVHLDSPCRPRCHWPGFSFRLMGGVSCPSSLLLRWTTSICVCRLRARRCSSPAAEARGRPARALAGRPTRHCGRCRMHRFRHPALLAWRASVGLPLRRDRERLAGRRNDRVENRPTQKSQRCPQRSPFRPGAAVHRERGAVGEPFYERVVELEQTDDLEGSLLGLARAWIRVAGEP
jgi:hypothetical protein